MKIDFDASVRDLERVLGASTKKAAPGKPFGPVLGSLLAKSEQLIETAQETSASADAKAALARVQADPMASFKFAGPTGKTPEISRSLLPPPKFEGVNEPEPGVKKPTILEARRVELHASPTSRERAENMVKVSQLVQSAGLKHRVDPALSLAVVSAESNFDPTAVSSDGHASKGLMQLLDTTGKDLHLKSGQDVPYDPFNPELNIDLGVGYLRYLHDIFSQQTTLPKSRVTIPAGDASSLEKFAVAAYNAGEGRVAAAQQVAERRGLNPADFDKVRQYLPEITQQYVERVMRFKDRFVQEDRTPSAIPVKFG